MNINTKRIVKILGNILTILAVLFIVKKMMNLDIDYSILMSWKKIIGIGMLSIIYGMIILIYGWPWRNYIKIISKVKVNFKPVLYVIAKSNLMKYIPGNVFQYIGRNELAIKYNLKHRDVAMATIFDVITNLIAAAILGILFYFEGFCKVILQYQTYLSILCCIGIAILTILLVFIWVKNRTLVKQYVVLFWDKNSIIKILLNLLFYMVNMLINALMYIATLFYILGISLEMQQIYVIMGAYILAWIVGFVMPGAPGGIGIREAIMTLLIPKGVPAEKILLGLVVYRLINILGDAIGFSVALGIKCLNGRGMDE